MAITTTGSTVQGLIQGLAGGVSNTFGKILNVNGNPDGKVSWTPLSGIAYDVDNGTFYMYKGGSSWSGLAVA